MPHDSTPTARARIGQQATLDYPLSPYHGIAGRVVDVATMRDGQTVYTIEWPDGAKVSYTPDRLTFEAAARDDR